MGRDSSGNYTLPGAYNPVLTGTTITSAWANNTLNDVASALTDSLSRSGKGAMQSALLLLDGTAGAPGLSFGAEQTTGLYRAGASQPTFVVTGTAVWGANASHQFLLFPIDNQATEIANLASATNGFWYQLSHGGVEVARFGSGPATLAGAALGDFAISAKGNLRINVATGNFIEFLVNNANVGTISSAGAWSIPIPTAAATALVVNGASGQYALQIVGNSASGNSRGLQILAGTTNADLALQILNQGNTQPFFTIFGDGETFVFTPTAASSPPASSFQVGYMDMPINPKSAGSGYQLGFGDRGFSVRISGATITTVVIPANSVTALPVGQVTMIRNTETGSISITCTDTLTWLPSNNTGNRTLAAGGIATVHKVGTTSWEIWGSGIT